MSAVMGETKHKGRLLDDLNKRYSTCVWGPYESLESSAPVLDNLYDLHMSSFHQLKAKRDTRHPTQHVQSSVITEKASGSSSPSQGASGQPGSNVLPDGVELRTDEKRGRGLYTTRAYKSGTFSSNYCGNISSARQKCFVDKTSAGCFECPESIICLFWMSPHTARDSYQVWTYSLTICLWGV
jgi:hypothetical protein